MWTGSAAVCMNDKRELLMVLQGKPEEEKRWSIPSGGRLDQELMKNAVYGRFGKRQAIASASFVICSSKKSESGHVHYFSVDITGGSPVIQDPDELIYQIEWKSIEEVRQLSLCFEEDRAFFARLYDGKEAATDRNGKNMILREASE